ncbi:MAG: Ppx/GppA family phosphatase [Nitrospirae bacterium]|jgi:exopolyphosphatase / guanosine-5'-triphosphate,3'-diphosphate pyrophosphatase|nr:Ppx/GppA family phosphatase [Nitrospirota bacterium]
MYLFASIDVGANTLRLLIGKIENNRIIDIFYERKITRLGTGVNQTGKLQQENIETSLSVLREFSSVISRYNVKHVKAVATSALREASNPDIFIERVFRETGILIEVIQGEKEADLALKGIISSCSDPTSLKQPLFIVDMGGGSTEWILYRGKKTIERGSIPIGVIKLSESYIKSDPVSEGDIIKIKDKTISFLEDIRNKIGQHLEKHTIFIGTAGTFTTIASIDLGLEGYSREKIHLHKISVERLHEMSRKLLSLSLQKRKKIMGLEPERADLIIPGLVFTISIMEFLKFNELTVSDYGLLEGILFDIKEKFEKNISETGKP